MTAYLYLDLDFDYVLQHMLRLAMSCESRAVNWRYLDITVVWRPSSVVAVVVAPKSDAWTLCW